MMAACEADELASAGLALGLALLGHAGNRNVQATMHSLLSCEDLRAYDSWLKAASLSGVTGLQPGLLGRIHRVLGCSTALRRRVQATSTQIVT